MKTPNPDHPVRNTLKHLALGAALGIALLAPANATPVTTGLSLWLDASDATTMTIDGSGVAEWRDKNGSAAKMTRRGGAPTVVATGIGGIPTVRLNGADRMNDGVNHAAPVTIFYVSRQTGGDNERVLSAVNNNWLLGYWGGRRGSAYFNGNIFLNGNGASDTNPHLYAATIGGTGVNSTVWAEGVQIASNQNENGTQGPNNLQLNGWQNGGENSNCEISEVLVYNRILNATELNAVGGYLAGKYSLTTSYPPPNLTVTLTSPLNNQAYLSGDSVSVTASVVSGTAPYTVKFFTRSLPGGTFAQAGGDLTTPPYTRALGTLSDGSYEIYATATDSAGSPVTATSATRTFSVAPPTATTTTVVSSGSPSIYGNSVTFTATVTPAPSGGTVQFSNGVNFLGTPVAVNTTTGVASFTTSTLGVVGPHEISAEYSGFQTYEQSSTLASITQEVNKATLTVTAEDKVRFVGIANPPLTALFTGFKNGETLGTSGVTGTPALSTTAVPASPVGTYPISCAVGTLAAANYDFTTAPGTLSVVMPIAELAYDGFNYAAGVLAGNSGGSGFSGAWGNLEINNGGFTAQADGLTFSTLVVTGGRIEGNAAAGGGKSRVQRNLSTSPTGQIYGSYLYRQDTVPVATNVNGFMMGAAGESDNDSTVSIYANEWTRTTVGARSESTLGDGGASASIGVGTTYLVLFSANLIDNTPTVTMWMLSSAQFDTFKPGGLTEAELNGATVGTGSSNVWGRSTVTGTDATLDATNNVKFMAYGGFDGAAPTTRVSYDELRLSQTSLNDVAPQFTPFAFWANGTFTPPLTAKLPTDNQDSDSLNNLQEFAFGTLPTVSTGGSISYVAGGAITATGLPTVANFAVGGGMDYRAVFGRRKDYVAAGLTYTPQFSVDMASWENSATTPTVLTGAGGANPSEIEAVSVPYPLFIPYTRDGIPGFEKPTFFRLEVSQP